jgi:hypothetical protein
VNEEVDEGAHDPIVASEGREDFPAVLKNRIFDVLLTVRVNAECAAKMGSTQRSIFFE